MLSDSKSAVLFRQLLFAPVTDVFRGCSPARPRVNYSAALKEKNPQTFKIASLCRMINVAGEQLCNKQNNV